MPEPVRNAAEQDRQPREEATFTQTESVAPDNRRREPRFSVDLDVTMSSEHNFYAGLAENISAGGLFIATHLRRPVGEKMEITVNLPGGVDPIHAIGEVCWVRLYSDGSNVSPGLGIRFTELPAGASELIERFVKNREPLFYDDE